MAAKFVTFILCSLLYNSKADFVRHSSSCSVPVLTQSGWVCGTIRSSYNGSPYASFRGIPYARQPLGKLRFVAPEPVDPWEGYFNASVEGPICVQGDYVYGPMKRPQSVGEACLRVNVHVPGAALPARGAACGGAACRPVLVFVHGGGFQVGSGDADINGPEYIVDRDVVLVTLNYRLGVFGFLSLNTSLVPGNTGLRDVLAALRWVRRHARAFGGDPSRVTLAGQSAGAAAVHILSLSDAARGLFTKVITMSGTASSGFFSSSPSYARYVLDIFLEYLGIDGSNAEEVHRRLIDLPYRTLLDATDAVLRITRSCAFNPVVESKIEGVTRILDENPDILVARGKGGRYPLVVGHTSAECETTTPRDIIARIHENPTNILPIKLFYSDSEERKVAAAEKMVKIYFNGAPALDKYVVACTESTYVYPALKLAVARAAPGAAPTYSYRFSYSSDSAPVKLAFGLHYKGAGHLEDLSYVLRVNSILGNTTLNICDAGVKDRMTTMIGNFVRYSNPSCSACSRPLLADIGCVTRVTTGLSPRQRAIIQLYDSFYGL